MTPGDWGCGDGVSFDDGWSPRPTQRPPSHVVEPPAPPRDRLFDAPEPPRPSVRSDDSSPTPFLEWRDELRVPPPGGYDEYYIDDPVHDDINDDINDDHDRPHPHGVPRSPEQRTHAPRRHLVDHDPNHSDDRDDAPLDVRLTRRELGRLLDRRERLERAAGRTHRGLARRRSPTRVVSDLGADQHLTPTHPTDLRESERDSRRGLHDPGSPLRTHPDCAGPPPRLVDPGPTVKRPLVAPVQGVALLIYFALLPYVIWTKWTLASHVSHGWILRDALSGLALFWVVFVGLVVAYVTQLRHRRDVPRNGVAWVAGLIIALLPFLAVSSAGAQTVPTRPVHSVVTRAPESERASSLRVEKMTTGDLESLPLALLAVSRRRRLADDAPDDELLTHLDPHLIARLSELLPADLGGVVDVGEEISLVEPNLEDDPLVGCLLRASAPDRLRVSYARPGGILVVDEPVDSSSLLDRLHPLHRGDLVLVNGPEDAWRALAIRPRDSRVVVVRRAGDDPELLARVVRVATETPPLSNVVRVELLRPLPVVSGVVEPFVATLRRRCVEMVAYLALHRGEPVTGDRLRSRVLTHAQVDASRTTLANTATSVRRSLGTAGERWRLGPVGPNGLYELHDVEIDVAEFHLLIAAARRDDDPYDSLVRALSLVKGEPLASVLKGFEWFRFEGHLAQLQREGEAAALTLADLAMERHLPDVAFWALRQGLLIDPESPALREEFERTPRGHSLPRHESSNDPGRQLAGTWAVHRFGEPRGPSPRS